MPAAKPELRAECVRLRRDERLTIPEIHRITGASKGSLSLWLKDYPLTQEELKERRKYRRKGGLPKKERGVESELHKITMINDLTTTQIAKVSEAAVLLKMLAYGLTPFGSMFDGDKTDWLVEASFSNVWKVQVKTALKGRGGAPIVSLRCNAHGDKKHKRRYRKGEFDFIVGYDIYTDVCYVWSWDEVVHLSCGVSICAEAEERWDKLLGE